MPDIRKIPTLADDPISCPLCPVFLHSLDLSLDCRHFCCDYPHLFPTALRHLLLGRKQETLQNISHRPFALLRGSLNDMPDTLNTRPRRIFTKNIKGMKKKVLFFMYFVVKKRYSLSPLLNIRVNSCQFVVKKRKERMNV